MASKPTPKKDDEIDVVVLSQLGTYEHTFPKTAKLSEVITAAAAALGFNQADRLDLVLDTDRGNVLDPNRPLVSYHFADGIKFLLTATGNGV